VTPDERPPLNEAIAAARIEARRRELVRTNVMRHLAELVIADLEEQILAIADDHNIADRASFLEYIEMMMGNRVIERRLAP
jgi:hypothetical protein